MAYAMLVFGAIYFTIDVIDFWSAVMMLIIIMDPLGNIPLFHSVLGGIPEESRRRVMIRELFIALGILTMFLFLGNHILSILGLQKPAISIGGGVVLFLIAINMVFPQHGLRSDTEREDPSIVPLAIPFVAGPSAIAALILMASREPERMGTWMAALAIAWSVTAACILSSKGIMRIIGRRGLRAAVKLMGMLLILISIQMILNGIQVYTGQ
jgi:multiple antibiotic resistance protein